MTSAGNGPPPRPNLPHGTVLGCAPSGVIAYNCNYENIPEPADGEVVDMLTYANDARGKLAYSGTCSFDGSQQSYSRWKQRIFQLVVHFPSHTTRSFESSISEFLYP